MSTAAGRRKPTVVPVLDASCKNLQTVSLGADFYLELSDAGVLLLKNSRVPDRHWNISSVYERWIEVVRRAFATVRVLEDTHRKGSNRRPPAGVHEDEIRRFVALARSISRRAFLTPELRLRIAAVARDTEGMVSLKHQYFADWPTDPLQDARMRFAVLFYCERAIRHAARRLGARIPRPQSDKLFNYQASQDFDSSIDQRLRRLRQRLKTDAEPDFIDSVLVGLLPIESKTTR